MFFLLALSGCLAVRWQRIGATALRVLGLEKAKMGATTRPGRGPERG